MTWKLDDALEAQSARFSSAEALTLPIGELEHVVVDVTKGREHASSETT